MPSHYRVLVVDDSSFMRQMISDILEKDKSIKVVATAINGLDAVQKAREIKPDVITMDIEMPEMDGLKALRQIMEQHPTPVVMLSCYTQKGADATFKALELGAVDFVSKPSGQISLDIDLIAKELLEKVKAAAQISLNKRPTKFSLFPKINKPNFIPGANLQKVVAIGASTGGPRALHNLMAELPAGFEAGVLIVQHMPKGFTESFAERLDSISSLKVKEAENGDELLPGIALLAPGDYHMTLVKAGDRFLVELSKGKTVNGHRPSVDVMMKSAANSGLYTVGVLLTGMGEDGAEGMCDILESQGQTIAEHSSTSIVYGMPKAAVERNAAKYVLPLQDIPAKIVGLIKGKRI